MSVRPSVFVSGESMWSAAPAGSAVSAIAAATAGRSRSRRSFRMMPSPHGRCVELRRGFATRAFVRIDDEDWMTTNCAREFVIHARLRRRNANSVWAIVGAGGPTIAQTNSRSRRLELPFPGWVAVVVGHSVLELFGREAALAF